MKIYLSSITIKILAAKKNLIQLNLFLKDIFLDLGKCAEFVDLLDSEPTDNTSLWPSQPKKQNSYLFLF